MNSFVSGKMLKYFEQSRTKQLIWRPTLEVGHWPSYVGFNATVGQIDQLTELGVVVEAVVIVVVAVSSSTSSSSGTS